MLLTEIFLLRGMPPIEIASADAAEFRRADADCAVAKP